MKVLLSSSFAASALLGAGWLQHVRWSTSVELKRVFVDVVVVGSSQTLLGRGSISGMVVGTDAAGIMHRRERGAVRCRQSTHPSQSSARCRDGSARGQGGLRQPRAMLQDSVLLTRRFEMQCRRWCSGLEKKRAGKRGLLGWCR
nr:hypothetical protein CFP56_19438 [Quercus suber]